MLENLIYSKKKTWFEEELSNVPDTAIAFIGDTKEIYALGLYFGGGYTKEEIDEMLSVSKFEFVDLGLPSGLKWATCNIGATKPEDFGLYFAWGETEGYSGITDTKKFNWDDYKLCGGSSSTLTKYNTNSSYGTVDNLTTLEQVDDAAYQSDNTCRMPTKADLEELTANTTSVWETLNGVNGRRFTSKTNGNSIFVPSAGCWHGGSFYGVGSYGGLWSSSLNESNSRRAWGLGFDSGSVSMDGNFRYYGFTVRAVQEANTNTKFNPSETVSKVNNLESQIGDINEMLSISKFEFVDLGLPSGLKWATTNVGATKPEEYGLYFAWGETEGYSGITSDKGFYWGDYKYSSGQTSSTNKSFKGVTKYNSNSSSGIVDNLTVLEQVDDAAYQSGNTCRMPTKADLEELTANTTSVWETLNGVNGRRFTSKTNGNSIFVPAAGLGFNGSVGNVGSFSYLWSSSLNEGFPRSGWHLCFSSSRVEVDDGNRYIGFSVRAVQEANTNTKFNPSETVSKVNNLESQIVDINAALDYIINGPRLITFTISGFEYQAEEGMTWEEFCNSKYNVDNFKAYPDHTEGIALPNDKFDALRFSFAWAAHTADDFYSRVKMNEAIFPKEYYIYLEK